MQLDRDALLQAYRNMKVIRCFEERLHLEIKTGEIAGFTHLYAGQEAVAVGVCELLDKDDKIVSTHRGHGHCLAKGCDVKGMMQEIYGRVTGLCKGKGGSMHIADIDQGMLGANGIVGAGAPIAVGAAMAYDIAGRAEGFGMKAWRANGSDFFDVYETMRDLLDYVRAGNGPAAIEFDTERYFGHFEGDPQRYRGEGELDRIREERDPLKAFRARIDTLEKVELSDLDKIDDEVLSLIDAAVEEARAAPKPSAEDVLTDVYVTY